MDALRERECCGTRVKNCSCPFPDQRVKVPLDRIELVE
jgi:hypothetical protein